MFKPLTVQKYCLKMCVLNYICPDYMHVKSTYRFSDFVSATFMVLTLLWLTVSTPFIVEVQKELHATQSTAPVEKSQEDNTNPFSGLNEERSSEISISEYLHHSAAIVGTHSYDLEHGDSEGTRIYIAFYGELLSPPPEGSFLLA